MSRAKHWVFTLNNPKHTIVESDLEDLDAEYLVFQEEIGESGTHHLQGYVVLKKKARLTHFAGGVLEGAHFEVARGTPEECDEYSSKEDTRVAGTVPVRFGKLPGGKGIFLYRSTPVSLFFNIYIR